MIDMTKYISRCCKAEVGFYDWYICAECGATIHDPSVDADASPAAEPTEPASRE